MKKEEKLVITTAKAGEFSAEEATRLALIAAYSKNPSAKKAVGKVLGTLEGRAKTVGERVVASNVVIGNHASPKKIGAAKSAKKPTTVTKATKKTSEQQRIDRLSKWGKTVG